MQRRAPRGHACRVAHAFVSDPPRLRRVLVALAAWAFAYACYRGYYALGGQAGMIGRPVSAARFREVNAIGTASSCSPRSSRWS